MAGKTLRNSIKIPEKLFILKILSVIIMLTIAFIFFDNAYFSNNRLKKLFQGGEDIYWAAAQLQISLEKFHRQLYIAKMNNIIDENTIEQFNILSSKLFILKNTPEIKERIGNNSVLNTTKNLIGNYLINSKDLIDNYSNRKINAAIKDTEKLEVTLSEFALLSRTEELLYREEQRDDSIKNQYLVYISFIIIWLMISFLILYLFAKNKKIIEEIKKKNYLITLQEEARESAIISETTKDSFFGSVTHELKSPLQRILGSVQILENNNFKDDSYIKYTKRIRLSTDHLIRLVDDILKMTMLGAGKLKTVKTLFDFSQIIEDTYSYYNSLSKNKGIYFSCTNHVLTPIVSDKERIRQILCNLISNSIRYTETGEINVSTKLEIKKDKPSLLYIIVTDTGIGIPKEYLEKVFLPFMRVPNRKREGHGLGLAITKGLIDLLSGKITIESNNTIGTKVSVYLPVKILPTINHILVVDDDETIRDSLLTSFKELGYIVDQASSVKEACKLIQSNKYTAMLIDIELGDGEAHDIFRHASQVYRHGFLSVAMTACDKYFNEEKYKEFDSLLLKPVNILEIKEALGLNRPS